MAEEWVPWWGRERWDPRAGWARPSFLRWVRVSFLLLSGFWFLLSSIFGHGRFVLSRCLHHSSTLPFRVPPLYPPLPRFAAPPLSCPYLSLCMEQPTRSGPLKFCASFIPAHKTD